jgi:excisionase family DNA binding protein
LREQCAPAPGSVEEYAMTNQQITKQLARTTVQHEGGGTDLLPSSIPGKEAGAYLDLSITPLPSRKLSVKEAAAYLGLSVSTLNKMRLNGTGPPYLKLGRRVLYDLRDLEEWTAERKRNHTSEQL